MRTWGGVAWGYARGWRGAAARTFGTARASEAGQTLALGVLWLALGVFLLLAVPALAMGYAEHAGVQSAADAAALACASRATITSYVDARGEVYQQTAAVNASTGPPAAAAVWGDNLAYWPLQTVSFAAIPSGAHCTVRVEVRSTIPLLDILHPGRRGFEFGTTAAARAFITPP